MINVSLTPTEALYLSAVLSLVGGHPENSGREHTDRIYNKLKDQGMVLNYNVTDRILEGQLNFRDYNM